MPHLQVSSSTLQDDGPIIELWVGVPQALHEYLVSKNTQVPPPIKVNALIDTGAGGTCFRRGVLAPLGLQPVGTVPVCTAGQITQASQYSVRLGIMPVRYFKETTVLEIAMEGQNIDCLIGRDTLSGAILIYQGSENTFTLSY
jgi:predicted aspartyl protease